MNFWHTYPMKLAAPLIFIVIPWMAHATTWQTIKVDDPIIKGEHCSVHGMGSYGAYIYNWPSKYDQVFWPLTDAMGLWFCAQSGFTAFIGDFNNLSTDELARIRAYLSQNPPENDAIETKLVLLERIYALRDTDEAEDNRVLRVLARWYQELGEVDKANTYRKRALPGIESALDEPLEDAQRAPLLVVAANYSRQFGAIASSDHYLRELNELLATTKSESLKSWSEHYRQLAEETRLITAGGVLDPVVPQSNEKTQ